MSKRMLVAAALSVLLFPLVSASAQQAGPAAASLKDITVSFKMDPLLGGSTYGGERWLSPPTFTSAAQPGTVGTVEARVEGVDASGRAVKVVPEWTAADPEMVTVTPGPKHEFRISVKRAGESKLTVTAPGVSRELLVKAKNLGKTIQVEIRQEPAREQRPPASGSPAADAAVPAPEPAADKAKGSYALGLETGKRLKGQFPELEAELVSRGVRDALEGVKPLFTEEERKVALAAVQYAVRTQQVEGQKQLAAKNKKDGETLLAENKAREGVVTLATGLQYKVLRAAEGPKPTIDDTVICHYRGTFADGTEFDDSHKRQRPATFALKRVIPGWREALQLMPVGSKWQIFVPPSLAYGSKGARGTIGPNATLVFEVELLSIKNRHTATAPRPASPQHVASDR